MTLITRHRRMIGLAAIAASALLIVLATRPSPHPQAHRGPDRGPRPATRQATGQATGRDIDRLLPVDDKHLAAAADLARRFIVAYGTYRYDEPPQAFLDRITPLVGEQLHTELDRAARDETLRAQRSRDRVVATADARVRSIRHLDADSIDFVITGDQHIATAAGDSDDTTDFAVTLTTEGDGWTVYAVQPATAGQSGDSPP